MPVIPFPILSVLKKKNKPPYNVTWIQGNITDIILYWYNARKSVLAAKVKKKDPKYSA